MAWSKHDVTDARRLDAMERLALEGNSVFTDLRAERDVLAELAHERAHTIGRLEKENAALRAEIAQLRDERANQFRNNRTS